MPSLTHLASVFLGNSWRNVFPLGLAGIIVWSLWLFRAVTSRFGRAIENDFSTTVSVVVPSYREDPEILVRCVESWLGQNPNELIIVLDTQDVECAKRLAQVDSPLLNVITFDHRGKRSALGVGIRAASMELVVLSDSDTMWEPDLLKNVQMPFKSADVGAVSTQQNVYQRTSSVWRRIADWMVNLRYYDYVPAMGRKGGVICVSGRTAAYRRSVIVPVLDNLENEFFLGRRCVAGDDGRLTWLVLASGYKTVHQRSARAMSMFPDTFRAFCKQRVRWGRNSYRTYLTALWKGWLWRVPFVSKVMVVQILVTPITMGLAITYLFMYRITFDQHGLLVGALWLLAGRAIRSYSHLRRHPQEILLLPLYALVVVFVALPLKAYALVTMNKQGWLTRTTESVGGDGQSAATLSTSEVTA
jgi:N-acetylglucosaminyltransferase